MTNYGPLSVSDVVALATITGAAASTARVARFMPEDSPLAGSVVQGTARSVGDERGNFLGAGEDVRDAYLRVTTRGGMECFWPVRELMADVESGTFAAEYDWS